MGPLKALQMVRGDQWYMVALWMVRGDQLGGGDELKYDTSAHDDSTYVAQYMYTEVYTGTYPYSAPPIGLVQKLDSGLMDWTVD